MFPQNEFYMDTLPKINIPYFGSQLYNVICPLNEYKFIVIIIIIIIDMVCILIR